MTRHRATVARARSLSLITAFTSVLFGTPPRSGTDRFGRPLLEGWRWRCTCWDPYDEERVLWASAATHSEAISAATAHVREHLEEQCAEPPC